MPIECDHHGALILPSADGSSPGTCSRCGEDIAGRKSQRAAELTAPRSENSVLFSLASLRALSVEARPEPAAHRPPPKPTQTEGSGLIDVRALDAMIRPAGRAAPPRAPRFEVLTASPLALAPAAVAVRGPTPLAPAPLPLYILLGIVALGMMALAGHLATRGPTRGPIVIERHVMAAAAAPEEAAGEAEPEDAAEPEEAAPEAAEPTPVASTEPAPAEPVKNPRRPVKRPSAPEVVKDVPVKPAPVKPATPAVATGPAPDSVECLLAADACKKPSAPAPVVEKRPDPADSLPEKLEPTDIIEGTRAAKAAALERCRAHARGGEKVTIKLSIAGPEGSVLSASAQDDAGNPALARCAAAELKRATFKKVRKAQVGAVATLKF